jgi:predicted HicB family RNase H-like nuclease
MYQNLQKQVRVSSDLHTDLKAFAAKQGCSMASLVNKFIESGIKQSINQP